MPGEAQKDNTDPFDRLHDAVTGLFYEIAKAMRVPEVLDWLTIQLERLTKRLMH